MEQSLWTGYAKPLNREFPVSSPELTFTLSRSFRFGPKVARLVNEVLALKPWLPGTTLIRAAGPDTAVLVAPPHDDVQEGAGGDGSACATSLVARLLEMARAAMPPSASAGPMELAMLGRTHASLVSIALEAAELAPTAFKLRMTGKPAEVRNRRVVVFHSLLLG